MTSPKSSGPNANASTKGVRAPIDFVGKTFPIDTQNVIIVSSFLTDFDTKDVTIHSYRESLCKEKLSIIRK